MPRSSTHLLINSKGGMYIPNISDMYTEAHNPVCTVPGLNARLQGHENNNHVLDQAVQHEIHLHMYTGHQSTGIACIPSHPSPQHSERCGAFIRSPGTGAGLTAPPCMTLTSALGSRSRIPPKSISKWSWGSFHMACKCKATLASQKKQNRSKCNCGDKKNLVETESQPHA